jgi:molybdenum cofactor guanylyltransferase
MKAGAIILSGGKSRRMGTNKALLPVSEKPNIERIKDELLPVFEDMILVTNHQETYEFLNVKMVSDRYPGKGPLAGIHAGLLASDQEVNLVVACDMPFISAGLGAVLVENLREYDAVVPIIEGTMHPLFAVYRKKTIHVFENCLENNNLRMIHLLDQLNVLYLTEENLQSFTNDSLAQIFFNMNHPEEYQDVIRLISSEKNKILGASKLDN